MFYNPAQVINRDLSLAVLRVFGRRREGEFARGEKHARNRLRELKKKEKEARRKGGGGGGGGASAPPEGGAGAAAAPALRILEALAASGLRAIRYARELPGVGEVVACDLEKRAVEHMRRNVQHNAEGPGGEAMARVTPVQSDARLVMLQNPKEFDVVDLDPYGTPSMFLDTAVQTVADGGLMCVTATDMAVLCGNSGEVSWTKYGSYALRGKYCHEMALRILLASVEQHAVRHRRYIVPVLSVSIDFYVRVFVRVFSSAQIMKETPSKLSYVWQCVNCDSFELQPVGRTMHKDRSVKYLPGSGPAVGAGGCEHCGGRFNMGGPVWNGPIHDAEWTQEILREAQENPEAFPAHKKIQSIMTMVCEELPDAPLFMDLHQMSATVKSTAVRSADFRSALVNAGYRVSSSHCNPNGVKTDAPLALLWDVMRAWVELHPVKKQDEGSTAHKILQKKPTTEIDFTRAHKALSKAKEKSIPRFLPNPEPNWGPKAKAGRYLPGRKQQKRPAEGGPEGEKAAKSSGGGGTAAPSAGVEQPAAPNGGDGEAQA